mmetsp:Transcript_682/g.1640  ORF Transcript_682/g.1640 Transcript_682/m.1640 type:complete len:250 (-) Transcript_682:77-826(-)
MSKIVDGSGPAAASSESRSGTLALPSITISSSLPLFFGLFFFFLPPFSLVIVLPVNVSSPFVGSSVGDSDGSSVGDLVVGASVSTLGVEDGASVGVLVGSDVTGASEGSSEGLTVGEAVGAVGDEETDGDNEGPSLGMDEGVAEGSPFVGNGVGGLVGNFVGAPGTGGSSVVAGVSGTTERPTTTSDSVVVSASTGYGVGGGSVGYMVGIASAKFFMSLKPTSFLLLAEFAPLTNSALAFSSPTIKSPA